MTQTSDMIATKTAPTAIVVPAAIKCDGLAGDDPKAHVTLGSARIEAFEFDLPQRLNQASGPSRRIFLTYSAGIAG